MSVLTRWTGKLKTRQGLLAAAKRRLTYWRSKLKHATKGTPERAHANRVAVERKKDLAKREQQVKTAESVVKRHDPEPLRVRAWQEAGKEIGIREQGGNNRGQRVEAIELYAHGAIGEPYCVDGVIWSYGHAGSSVVKPGYPRAVTAMLVPGVKRINSPAEGDIVRFSFDHTALFGHWADRTGKRVAKAKATNIVTREFNTTSSGALSSDANDGTDGVYEKVRDRKLVADYLRVER